VERRQTDRMHPARQQDVGVREQEGRRIMGEGRIEAGFAVAHHGGQQAVKITRSLIRAAQHPGLARRVRRCLQCVDQRRQLIGDRLVEAQARAKQPACQLPHETVRIHGAVQQRHGLIGGGTRRVRFEG
jgi:hypothetical protein